MATTTTTLTALEQQRADAEFGATWRRVRALVPVGWMPPHLAVATTDLPPHISVTATEWWFADSVSQKWYEGESDSDDDMVSGDGATELDALADLERALYARQAEIDAREEAEEFVSAPGFPEDGMPRDLYDEFNRTHRT